MKPFIYTIIVEVERTEGKFASRDELQEQITNALEDANPSQVEGESGGQYEIISWDVQEQ